MRFSISKYSILIALFLFLDVKSTFSQYNSKVQDLQLYERSIDMFHKGLYESSSELMHELSSYRKDYVSHNNLRTEQVLLLQNDAIFYEIYALRRAGKTIVDSLLSRYVKEEGSSAKTSNAHLLIARSFYAKEQYADALKYYKKINPLSLSPEELQEVQFSMGYAHFENKEYDESVRFFSKLKVSNSIYQEASLYYFSYICYLRNDFEAAINSFEQLKGSKAYEQLFPYFRAALHYLNQSFDDVIIYVKPLLDDKDRPYNGSLLKLLASSYYAKSRYRLCIINFQRYISSYTHDHLTVQDSYQLGYSYYQEKEYDKAVKELKRMVGEQGEYGQWGLLTLADAYVKSGEKASARDVFFLASKHSLNNNKLKEDALANYIKIVCELEDYTTAIMSSKDFLQNYPYSKKRNEVGYLLALAYVASKDYQSAVDVLETLEERTDESNELYQKATYFRGLEFFKERAFENAISAFMRSGRYPIDDSLYALSLFWKSEAMYEVHKYSESVLAVEQFVSLPSAKNTLEYQKAYYSLGYAAFQNKLYDKAVKNFELYVKKVKSFKLDTNRLMDSYLRIADSYFTLKEYPRALVNYASVENSDYAASDYAMFQRGLIYGLQNKVVKKIETLNALIKRYPNSLYADDSNFEIAYSYFQRGENIKAREELEAMAVRYPESPYVPKALMTVGMSYYNDSEDAEALMTLKRLIKNYPSAEEAKQALKTIENIYIGDGNSEAFLEYIKDVPSVTYTLEDKDNLTFMAINNRFQKEDYQGVVNAITDYIVKYPQALHIQEAKFIRAESYVALKQPLDAVTDYSAIVTDWTTKFTRKSVIALCKIYLEAKQYNEAIPYLKKLELLSDNNKLDYEYAIYNLLDAYYTLFKQDDLMHYAQVVSSYNYAPKEKKCFASYTLGKVLALRGDTIAATKEYIIAAESESEFAAEAVYNIASFYFNKKEYIRTQKIIFEMGKQHAQHQYWLAKAYILLAETYVKEKNYFQARKTLQSILDNYLNSNDDILATAKEQLINVPEEPIQAIDIVTDSVNPDVEIDPTLSQSSTTNTISTQTTPVTSNTNTVVLPTITTTSTTMTDTIIKQETLIEIKQEQQDSIGVTKQKVDE